MFFLAWYNGYRWNPIAASPIIAIKYDQNKLTMIDLERSTQTLSALLELEAGTTKFVNSMDNLK